MSTGRIETYVHSDSITPNKGGAIVKVVCQTDFAAKTDEFKAFSAKIARLAYAAGAKTWTDILIEFPHVEDEMAELRSALKEKINVTDIVVMTLL